MGAALASAWDRAAGPHTGGCDTSVQMMSPPPPLSPPPSSPSSSASPLGLSGRRILVTYRLQASGSAARRMAEILRVDQTVEASEEVIPPGPIREHLLGRIESLESLDDTSTGAVISFPVELLGTTAAQCLHLLWGTSSLKPGIRLTGLEFPTDVPPSWPGPRFGRAGLRALIAAPARVLLCGVLKPLGRSAVELSDLAAQFAMGGVDFVKDDQGLADQAFCPFEDRVARCAAAVQEVNRRTGGGCRYVAHVGGTAQQVITRARFARPAGAGGLLFCPGLSGYDVLRELATDEAINLPIFSHPAFLGTYTQQSSTGIAPHVLYGLLPRLMGADVSIYPTWGGEFGLQRADCAAIAKSTAEPFAGTRPMFPTAAGRIGIDQLDGICDLYGQDVVIVLGSRIQCDARGVAAACHSIRATLDRVSSKARG